jgi:hypothetical protein
MSVYDDAKTDAKTKANNRDFKREAEDAIAAVSKATCVTMNNPIPDIAVNAIEIAGMMATKSEMSTHRLLCPMKGLNIDTKDIAPEAELRDVRGYALHDQALQFDSDVVTNICLTMGYSCAKDKARFERLRRELGKVINAFPADDKTEWVKFGELVNTILNAASSYGML